jgi:hypothetical protein
MSEALKTCDPMNLDDLFNATSSPASGSGQQPCAEQVGVTIVVSGQPHALVSLSARQAKAMGLLTSGIFGPHCSTSSSSVALQSSLENKLRAATQHLGSTLFKLTWKTWVTPSGLSRSRLRASVLRTSETGCTGWATTRASDWKGAGARAPEGCQKEYERGAMDLGIQAWLASWPTTTTRDWKDGSPCSNVETNALLGRAVWCASWPATQAGDEKWRYSTRERSERRIKSGKQVCLECIAHIADPVRLTASGEMLTGSSAQTTSGDRLNPALSRWLMGLREAWDLSAPGNSNWRAWQDLMQRASPMPNATVQDLFADTATQS